MQFLVTLDEYYIFTTFLEGIDEHLSKNQALALGHYARWIPMGYQ